MKEIDVTSILYRSVLMDGSLWCQSSDPAQVIRMSADHNCLFQKIVYYETTNGWEKWDGFHDTSVKP